MSKNRLESALYKFKTNRLSIDDLRDENFNSEVQSILTEEVTNYLPNGWQQLDTDEKIDAWIKERDDESLFFNIRMSNEIVGFCFLYISPSSTNKIDIRFGYLLSKNYWGKGIGTEFIQGLITWCENLNIIKSISGGVEHQNKGSIRVLEKTGFIKESENTDTIFYRKDF